MKGLVLCLVMVTLSVAVTNPQQAFHPFRAENKLFIITLDGFRWQELFAGADSTLIADPSVTGDTALAKAMYWAPSPGERRKKLLPFFWNIVARQGQLFGNRQHGNKVNVANPYALSYPGYSELLTGKVDLSLFNNDKRRNGNANLLDALNREAAYAGKVAAFTSWDVFPFILDEENSDIYLNSGPQKDRGLSQSQRLLNTLQSEVIRGKSETRYDELTYIACKEYILQKKPSVVFLSFSGTDDAGHDSKYDQYLQQANNADRMIGELWRLVQSMPEYAGKTTFLLTTDHGRGAEADTWHKHGLLVGGSSQTWYGLLGAGIDANGESRVQAQYYQKDLKNLAMRLLVKK